MMNKLISVSLAVKNKVTHGPNWLSAGSLLTMLGLLVMCRPHYEVSKTSPARANMVKVTPYPVSVKLQPDTSYLASPIYAILTEPTQSVEICEQKPENWRTDVIRFAMKYLGRPYRSAGKTPAGFDCSGFTGFVYSNFGHKLPSHSGSQALVGEKIAIKEAKKGDLAFFGWKTKRGVLVNHAAIVVSNPGEPLKIIHSASGKGIVLTRINESNYWKRMLLFVRRVDLGKDTDS